MNNKNIIFEKSNDDIIKYLKSNFNNDIIKKEDFIDFIRYCKNNNINKKDVKEILSIYRKNSNDDIILFFFSCYNINIKDFNYLIKIFKDISEFNILMSKINNIPFVNYNLILSFYNKSSIDNISTKNKHFDEFKKYTKRQNAKFTETPFYVNLLENEDRTMLNKKSKYKINSNLLSIDSIQNIISSVKIGDKVIDLEKAAYDFAKLAERYNEDGTKNIDEDRVFGPLNSSETECCVGGNCRMLECNCHLEEDEDHWFTGECSKCYNKIKDESHAVRIPLNEGGWIGCYCSFQCIENDNNIFFDDILYNVIKNDILHNGIMDRSLI